MESNPNGGIVTLESRHPVEQTVLKLEELLRARGVKVFAVIDHSGEAEKAGLSMLATRVVIFGNPKGGTPIMVAAPSAAIDLPLKILVAEDGAGKVWISYNSPDYLQRRHGFPVELTGNIGVVEGIAKAAGE